MSSYDQNLLDGAPKATRAQMQEGYNIDLLGQPSRRTPSVRIPPPQPVVVPAPVPLTPGIAETGSREKFGTPTQAYTAPRKSFWRSRNGIITIILIAVIIIGAVVGGAVGGTAGKQSNSNSVVTSGSANGTANSPDTPVGIPLGSSTSTAPASTQAIDGPAMTAGSGGTGSHALIPSAAPTGQNVEMGAPNTGVAGFSH